VALPVIVAATALKGARLRRRGVDRGLKRAMAVGVGASFASTLASQRLIRVVERDRALWPYAGYRAGVAALVLHRLWRGRRRPAALPPVAAIDGAVPFGDGLRGTRSGKDRMR
jgi:hypothetical protein